MESPRESLEPRPVPRRVKDQRVNRAASGRFEATSATSIWRAAEFGDIARLKLLLLNGCDINGLCDEPGRQKSPLSAAVDGNEPLAVRFLLQRGADPNTRDGDKDRCPLHWASAFGDYEECAQLLVHARADLGLRDAHGRTPLEFALASTPFKLTARPAVCAVLEAATAQEARLPWTPAHAAEALSSAFWKAAQHGDLDAIEKCLDGGQAVEQLRPSREHRVSALSIAVLHGQDATASLLLRRGADPNRASGEAALAPLHFAAQKPNRIHCARLLIEASADACLLSRSGRKGGETALAIAQRLGSKRDAEGMIELLKAAEATSRARVALTDAVTPGWLLPVSAQQLSGAIDSARAAGVPSAEIAAAEDKLREVQSSSGTDWSASISSQLLTISSSVSAFGWSWSRSGAPWSPSEEPGAEAVELAAVEEGDASTVATAAP